LHDVTMRTLMRAVRVVGELLAVLEAALFSLNVG